MKGQAGRYFCIHKRAERTSGETVTCESAHLSGTDEATERPNTHTKWVVRGNISGESSFTEGDVNANTTDVLARLRRSDGCFGCNTLASVVTTAYENCLLVVFGGV